MKFVVLVGDGMGDYPVAELGQRTPLQTARIPNIRRIAAAGEVRLVQTVPQGVYPGSDVANLSLLGYDPKSNYTGRAPIEAAGAGVPLQPADAAFRCNLVTIENGLMKDYSAGHITTPEGRQLITDLDRRIGKDGLRFHGGVSYRHLLVWRNGPVNIQTTPPHDIADRPVDRHFPAGAGSGEVRRLMDESVGLFASHPINLERIRKGLRPATQIWLWGQGRSMQLKSYKDLYGLSGGIVSAVDLVRGLGILAGLKADKIEGATGFLDTNFNGKVQAALDLLTRHNFVFVHVEAPDECGHIGDVSKKVQAIELFDERVVGPIWAELEKRGEPYRLLICTDHRTPVSTKGHTSEPVPMARLDGPVGPATAEKPFDEFLNNGVPEKMAYEWIQQLLKQE